MKTGGDEAGSEKREHVLWTMNFDYRLEANIIPMCHFNELAERGGASCQFSTVGGLSPAAAGGACEPGRRNTGGAFQEWRRQLAKNSPAPTAGSGWPVCFGWRRRQRRQRPRLPGPPAFRASPLGRAPGRGRGVVWRGAAAGVVVEASVGAAGGGAIRLATDRAGPPSVLHWQALSWFVIERQGRLAVRVRNRVGRRAGQDEIPPIPTTPPGG